MRPAVPAVSTRGMEFAYASGRTGLRPLDLRIETGEVVAVLGPNGSGKSTLLRLLATDLRPTAGELEILGQPVRGRLAPIRRQIGYSPDSPVHFEVLTGLENAEVYRTLVPPPRVGVGEQQPGLPPSSGSPPEELDSPRGRLAGLFRDFGLAEVSDLPVSEYSFGMKRKLLLVQCLSIDPPLVLLDEPSVGLDPEGMAALRSAIRSRGETGGTVVVATNEIREVPTWADRILFLHRGELVEDAPLPVLMKRLEGRTRIEIEFSAGAPEGWDGRLPEIAGVETARTTPRGLVVESSAGGGLLPAILEALLSKDLRVRDVRVREPDLGGLFLSLTGESLPTGSDGAPEQKRSLQ